MFGSWSLSGSDIAPVLFAGQVAVVCLLASVYVSQRRQHRATLVLLDRLTAATCVLDKSPPPTDPVTAEVIQLQGRRP